MSPDSKSSPKQEQTILNSALPEPFQGADVVAYVVSILICQLLNEREGKVGPTPLRLHGDVFDDLFCGPEGEQHEIQRVGGRILGKHGSGTSLVDLILKVFGG